MRGCLDGQESDSAAQLVSQLHQDISGRYRGTAPTSRTGRELARSLGVRSLLLLCFNLPALLFSFPREFLIFCHDYFAVSFSFASPLLALLFGPAIIGILRHTGCFCFC